MSTRRVSIVVDNNHLGYIALSDAEDEQTAREENVMRARDVIADVTQGWPDKNLHPQACLLLAARALSAIIRGCDTEESLKAWFHFVRDPTLENDIVTAYLRHHGTDHAHQLFAKMKTERLMRVR